MCTVKTVTAIMRCYVCYDELLKWLLIDDETKHAQSFLRPKYFCSTAICTDLQIFVVIVS